MTVGKQMHQTLAALESGKTVAFGPRR